MGIFSEAMDDVIWNRNQLAKWLDKLQWNSGPDCDACECCLMPAAGVGHRPDCELALALKEAGINVTLAAP